MEDALQLLDTGERMIPDAHGCTLMHAEHMTRYLGVQDAVVGKTVLDVASGSGYGAKLLATGAARVYGVEKDGDALIYARSRYADAKVEFLAGDALEIPLGDRAVDVVVSFETIEHLDDHARFLAEVKRVLRPAGLFVVSTPNVQEFTKGNPFHIHEFAPEELAVALHKCFVHVTEFRQVTWLSVAIGPRDALTRDGHVQAEVLNLCPSHGERAFYLYYLCSDRPITESVKPMVALGEPYSARDVLEAQRYIATRLDRLDALENELGAIKASRRYELAETMLKIKRNLWRWARLTPR